jgi:hypothetical protein
MLRRAGHRVVTADVGLRDEDRPAGGAAEPGPVLRPHRPGTRGCRGSARTTCAIPRQLCSNPWACRHAKPWTYLVTRGSRSPWRSTPSATGIADETLSAESPSYLRAAAASCCCQICSHPPGKVRRAAASMESELVGGTGIEPVTSSVSGCRVTGRDNEYATATWCSDFAVSTNSPAVTCVVLAVLGRL